MSGIDFELLLTIAAIVGAGLNGGIYFAYSTFTMQALRRLSGRDGAAAMQAINIEAPTPPFMSVFFGTAVLSLALVVLTLVGEGQPTDALVLAGANLYLLSIVVTIVYNVPLNDRLAAVDPDSPDGVAVWSDCQQRWTLGNHVRFAACALAATLLTLSIVAA